MRTNNHNWLTLFAGDTCRICFESLKTGAAKANHAIKHEREGQVVRIGHGTKTNPFNYTPIHS